MSVSLVLQLARFGDIVQTKRLIRTLCGRGETHLCVDASLLALARRVYPDVHVHGVLAHEGSASRVLAENMAVFSRLAALRPDAVYNVNLSGLNRAIVNLFDPESIRGYAMRDQQALQSRWTQLAMRWTASRRVSPVNLADFWAWFADNPLPPSQINPEAKPGGKGLGVVLAGNHARRSLDTQTLAGCVKALFEGMGGPPVFLLGSHKEKPLARQLVRHLHGRVLGKVVDLSGRTDWAGLEEAMSGLDCLLSPDTGTMHFAAHLGVPVCATFLSSAWAWETGPYGLGHTIFQAQSPCAPCVESQPCTQALQCARPFSSQQFMRYLAGGKENVPQGLWRMEPEFDAFGIRYTCAGENAEEASERLMRRALFAEHKGLCGDIRPSALLADTFYREADWMLPEAQP